MLWNSDYIFISMYHFQAWAVGLNKKHTVCKTQSLGKTV